MTRFKRSISVTAGGPGFLGWLALLFIGLKLTGYIHWPWIWVLSPFWIPCSLFLCVVALGIVFLGWTIVVEALSK